MKKNARFINFEIVSTCAIAFWLSIMAIVPIRAWKVDSVRFARLSTSCASFMRSECCGDGYAPGRCEVGHISVGSLRLPLGWHAEQNLSNIGNRNKIFGRELFITFPRSFASLAGICAKRGRWACCHRCKSTASLKSDMVSIRSSSINFNFDILDATTLRSL